MTDTDTRHRRHTPTIEDALARLAERPDLPLISKVASGRGGGTIGGKFFPGPVAKALISAGVVEADQPCTHYVAPAALARLRAQGAA